MYVVLSCVELILVLTGPSSRLCLISATWSRRISRQVDQLICRATRVFRQISLLKQWPHCFQVNMSVNHQIHYCIPGKHMSTAECHWHLFWNVEMNVINRKKLGIGSVSWWQMNEHNNGPMATHSVCMLIAYFHKFSIMASPKSNLKDWHSEKMTKTDFQR